MNPTLQATTSTIAHLPNAPMNYREFLACHIILWANVNSISLPLKIVKSEPIAEMSATTTANPVSGAVLNILKDYDIHHGNPENPGTPEPPNSQRDTPKPILNPEHWDNEHRRVPPYKPIDKRKRGPERPDGSNPIEVAFIFLMLNGCGLIGVSLCLFHWASDTDCITAREFCVESHGREAECSHFQI